MKRLDIVSKTTHWGSQNQMFGTPTPHPELILLANELVQAFAEGNVCSEYEDKRSKIATALE